MTAAGSTAGLQKMSVLVAGRSGGIGKAQPPVRVQRRCGSLIQRIRSRDFPLIVGIAPEEFPGKFRRVHVFQVSICLGVTPIPLRHHADFLPDSMQWVRMSVEDRGRMEFWIAGQPTYGDAICASPSGV